MGSKNGSLGENSGDVEAEVTMVGDAGPLGYLDWLTATAGGGVSRDEAFVVDPGE